ncbi:L,D-transpeptidase family protein [Hymenobacter sp. CRA2]|uniref:L,D-transpeptidase family protein n=1 Tax=Hymenobacter sp. CRA2 TaxID=1955620 RepID=UPI00098EE502|nr:L,D-transpeptidase family protein [Hymenobacter sp. CRA2]OON70302.1 hypothetical protein B0919_06105 [Hymenobacter sp. CRA2]
MFGFRSPSAAVLPALGLLLALSQCTGEQSSSVPESSPSRATAQPPSVGACILALLDTTAGAPSASRQLQNRSAVRALYGAKPTPLWSAADATAVLALLAQAPAYGLRPEYYHVAELRGRRDSLQQRSTAGQAARQARFDLGLSDAVLTFMRDLHRGRLTSSAAPAAPALPAPADTLRRGLAAHRVTAAVLACQPNHRPYRQLQAALARWLRQPVPPDSAAAYQARWALAALNLERWRQAPIADSEYMLINLPAFELQVVRHDSVLRRHRVIVGKPETPSPTLSSRITHFTLAPDWHVPHSIATREILPRLRTNPGYLARNNYALYDSRGQLLDPVQINWEQVTPARFAYTIRQSAGCDNALGNIVFRFPNPYAVYLHDTPARQAFAQPRRALSHGCIRLQQPMELAAYLLRRDGQQTQPLPSEEACARQPRPQDVRLRRPMPLHVGYFTCSAEQGQLRFHPDIYRRDEQPLRRLASASPGL